MTLRLQLLGLMAMSTLVLTACSGSSDQSTATPASTSPEVFVAKADGSDTKKSFTRAEMKQGSSLFKTNCARCHVGGQTYGTYNVREINLSLPQLKGATPPLDNLQTLTSYMKKPLSYDGTENLYDGGRHPKYDQLADDQLNLIAAHILKEANFNRTWGKGKDVR
jgi:photosystem II cytochrome c550